MAPEVFRLLRPTLVRMVNLERQSELAESQLRSLSGQIRTAQEQERRSLSRELHDQVGQTLTALRMELAGMALLHGDTGSELSSRIARSKGTVEQTLRVVRNIAMLLRPSMLDDLGLVSTLRWYADRQAQRAGFVLHFSVEPSGDRPRPDVATTCYRIVQEALSNVVRHARASEVWLEFHSNHDELKLLIRDNGVGFETVAVLDQSAKSMGFGILAMRERTENLNGKLEIESEPTRGTVIRVWIPVNR